MLKSIELPNVPLVKRSDSAQLLECLGVRGAVLLDSPDLDAHLDGDVGLEESLIHLARDLAASAYPVGKTTDRRTATWIDHGARSDFHRALLVLYKQQVQIAPSGRNTYQFHPFACRIMRELERPWEQELLRRAHRDSSFTLGDLPSDPGEFARWYQLAAFGHPLY